MATRGGQVSLTAYCRLCYYPRKEATEYREGVDAASDKLNLPKGNKKKKKDNHRKKRT